VGKTDLEELKALMGRLCVFVTNDSGPMHLAAAAGVPVVAIFGATTRELGFFPYGPGHRVVEADLACRPCGLHGASACPEGHFLCMKLLTVLQVHAAVLKVVRAAPAVQESRSDS
ncbi:MAG: glycosyltransferase family 9 protein, partial [Elusimicrobiota bacterium]|nr:glycosyltransferase family 9 protein [Elusimicrobiota bacterium]